MSKIKTFRGLLGNLKQDQIHLSGGDDKTAYRIHKFQLIPNRPGAVRAEHVVKIYSKKQSSIDPIVNFDDDTLLAAAIQTNQTDANDTYSNVITFDKEPFNQDIYVTHDDQGTGDESVNYYLELEEFSMKDPEAAVVNYKAALLHGE